MDIILRAAIVFFLILLLTRVIGRRELSSMEPFDLILLVVIGDLIQQGVTQQDNSITGAALAITTIALLTVAMAFLSAKSRPFRRIVEGAPIVLVSDGQIVERNLRRERLTVHELAAEARLQQVASLDDVRYAVLETSGKISVIPKEDSSA
jgi:uncharacterized membrane protein YcaP (DUF421 family)